MNSPADGQRRLGLELWLVLGVSLGASAVYSILSLIQKLSAGSLRSSTTQMNASQDDRSWLDLIYQLVGIGFALVPAALALYFMSLDTESRTVRQRLGFDRESPIGSTLWGLILTALIGIPGLGIYFLGRELGITSQIVASALESHWWVVPVLIAKAFMNGVLEEVVVVGFMIDRLKRLHWGPGAAIAASAILRGSYHLYQGFGQALGNVAMGAIFGWWYHRTGRVLPLVIAHTLLDVVAFVGYALFADRFGLR